MTNLLKIYVFTKHLLAAGGLSRLLMKELIFHPPDSHDNLEILFKGPFDVLLKVELRVSLGCQMCLKAN